MSLVFKTPKSTLNTTTGEGQNIGYGDCPECPECPKVELSDVDVEYTENGEYTLTPEGDGFSSVGITVNIDTKAIEDAAYAEGEAAGIITGKAQGVAEQKAKLTSTTITENGTTTREDGWNSVTVNVDVETPYNNGVVAGEAAQKAKLESATFVSNGTYTKEDGYNEVTVNVPSDVNNQTKNVTISSNGTETITADSGYSGLGSVEVTVDVPEKQLTDTLETYTSNGEYTITPPTGYDGLSEVNVSVQIDEQAIYQDGFNSGLDAGIAEQKAKLTSTTFSSNDTFTNEDGWNEVTVDVQPNLDVLEVTPSTQSQQFLPESGYDGFSQVDVDPVTSAIDSNITASNIKKDVTILGVTGSYDPQPDLETKTVTYTANNTYTIIPTDGKDGISLATVTVNVPSSTVETGATYTADVIGTHTIEPSKGYDGMDSVELTVNTDPLGSYGSPFDDYLAMLKIDFEGGCYYSNIASGRINETTGYYDAENGGGEVLHIKPYISDGGDPATYSFPEDFDLKEKEVVVYFLKENATLVTDEKSGDVIGVDINECELVSINGNANPETWLGGNCPDWSSIGWDCNDVANSGLEADIAYTAQAKAEFEAGTITQFNTKTLVFAPNITLPSDSSSLFANQGRLKYLPQKFDGTPTNINNMFQAVNLKTQPQFNWSNVTTAQQAFYQSSYNGSIPFNPIINAPECLNFNNTFSGGTYPTAGMTTATITAPKAKEVSGMFQNEIFLRTVDLTFGEGTLNNVAYMFNTCKALESVPLFDTSKVNQVQGMFGYCANLTTLGGFTNLGKAFTGTNATSHTLDLSPSKVLTKESIMNVINNLAAPDDTTATDATLKLSAASYALLTEEDIAIATAKNWSVVSA